ncbi:MAG TPA: hypothetical protein VE338_00115 [Ktedonobacterales bacterium]|jgi:hypothetical protein|nr:hypothetical protein [Ktedonobacterales bacterium]
MAETKSSAKNPSTGATPAQTPGPSLGQRIAGVFRAPISGSSSQGTGFRRKTSSTTRFIVGSVTFILVAELLTYLIDYANIQFKLNLNQPIIGASASWLTWFFLINVVLILGLWILLNKMGFFPRDMWAPRNGTSAARGAASQGNGSAGNKKSADQIPGIGKARTRAERRYAAEAAAAAAAAKTTKAKGRPASADSRASAAEIAYSSDHDEAYDRAKAAQRLRMRRARR